MRMMCGLLALAAGLLWSLSRCLDWVFPVVAIACTKLADQAGMILADQAGMIHQGNGWTGAWSLYHHVYHVLQPGHALWS